VFGSLILVLIAVIVVASTASSGSKPARTATEAKHIFLAHLPRRQLYRTGVNRLPRPHTSCPERNGKRGWMCEMIVDSAPIYGGDSKAVVIDARVPDDATKPHKYSSFSCPVDVNLLDPNSAALCSPTLGFRPE
jgi:hypothetical protein